MEAEQKINYLEGLRGLAALIVVLGHIQLAFYPRYQDIINNYLTTQHYSPIIKGLLFSLSTFFLDGGLSVYIFWFLSAYVINIKLIQKADQAKYVHSALFKRYFRLMFPVLAMVVFTFVLLKLNLIYNKDLGNFLGANPNDWIFMHYNFEPNFFNAIKSSIFDTFFSKFNKQTTYNVVLWTMHPELYGSLVSILIFYITKNLKFRQLYFITISAMAIIIGREWIVSFLLGFLLADIKYNKSLVVFNFSGALNAIMANKKANLILFIVLSTSFGNYSNSFSKLILSTLIVVILVYTPLLQNFFDSKILIWLGKISFGLYLIHLPLICSLPSFLLLNLNLNFEFFRVVMALFALVLSVGVAHLFTNWIDGPSIKLSNTIGKYLTQ